MWSWPICQIWRSVNSCHITTVFPKLIYITKLEPTSLKERPDILDLFITSQIPSSQSTIEPLHELPSDHSQVLLHMRSYPMPKSSPPSLITGPVNWDNFHYNLQNKVDKIPLRINSILSIGASSTTIYNIIYTTIQPTPKLTEERRANRSGIETDIHSTKFTCFLFHSISHRNPTTLWDSPGIPT